MCMCIGIILTLTMATNISNTILKYLSTSVILPIHGRFPMNSEQEVEEIVARLQGLNLEQAELLTRLARLSERSEGNDDRKDTKTREFEIGDSVKINNPGPFQATKGTVVKIGKGRITVLARNGTKVVRAPKNLSAIKKDQ